MFHLKDAGSLRHALQHAGLIAVLEEDGSVVVNILHFNKHGGRAGSAAACRSIIYQQKQTRRLILV